MEKVDILNQIMESSCSKDNYRDWLTKPFVIEDKAYATDAHILIVSPKKLTSFTKTIENPERIFNVIPKSTIKNKSYLVKNLKRAITKIPFVDEYTNCNSDAECSTCDGDGEVEWEFEGYTKEDECPVCNGDGKITESKRIKTGHKVKSDKHVIELNNAYFNHIYIERIIRIANLFSVKEIQLLNNPNTRQSHLFKIGEIEVLLMPMTANDKTVKINV